MPRYIDADDFFETFEELDKEPYINFPASDVRENVRGEWKLRENQNLPMWHWYECSNCGAVIGTPTRFCSECGADMRG